MNIDWNNWDVEENDDEIIKMCKITTDIGNDILMKYIEFIKLYCEIM